MKMKKIDAIKLEINHRGLIDSLLCKKELSTWKMPVRAQCEVELQVEMDWA